MHPKIEALYTTMKAAYPHMAALIEQNIAEFGSGWENDFGAFLATVEGNIFTIEKLVRSYVHFSLGIMLSQTRYEQSGAYEYSSFDEVKANIYDNEAYVNDEYMPGLLFSHYLWPHHYRLLKFFEGDVLNELAMQKPQTFCEVGVGTALYSLKTAARIPDINGMGYDISAPALDFGQNIINRFGKQAQISLELRDIMTGDIPSYDFLICQEVLEHLENPAEFSNRLAVMIKPGGRAYITAAMTAGQVDHIYLFETLQEVYDMLQEAQLVPLMVRMEGARTYNDLRRRPRVAAFYCIRAE